MTAGYKKGLKKARITKTLMARDYKGVSNEGINVVIEQ